MFTIFISNNHVPFQLFVKEIFGKLSPSSKILSARLQVSEMALVCHGTLNSNKIYFLLIT